MRTYNVELYEKRRTFRVLPFEELIGVFAQAQDEPVFLEVARRDDKDAQRHVIRFVYVDIKKPVDVISSIIEDIIGEQMQMHLIEFAIPDESNATVNLEITFAR